MYRNGLVVGLIVLFAASALAAPPPAEKAAPKAPAAAGAPKSVPLKATVVSVSGPAQKLLAAEAGKKWEPLEAGEELSELTVIRTGLGAKVVLKFADRGELVINNATKIGIGELRQKGDEVKADLGLKYGTVRASVDSSRGKNDFRISTPVATLSVRGSWANVGFMADSPRMLDAGAGLWRVLRLLTLAEARPDIAERIVQAGEVANSTPETPITIALKQRATQMFDGYGVTFTEQKTLIQNPTGIRVINTPSSGNPGTVPTNVVPTVPEEVWPWPPWP